MVKTYSLLSAQIRSVAQKGFFHLLSANFLIQFLGFGTSLLVAKFLTPVQLGEIRIIQSYAIVFGVLAVFGHSSAVLKTCAEAQTLEQKESILKSSVRRVFFTTALSFSLLAGLAYSGWLTSSPYLSTWLLVYALILPFSSLTEVLISYLQALKKIREMARAQSLIKIQSFILIILSTAFFGFRGFIYSTIFAYFLGLIPLLFQVGRRFMLSPRAALPVTFTSVAVFSFLANGINVVGQYGDLYILDHFVADREAIGYYSFAVIFVLAARQITGTVQSISTPYFSERSEDLVWFRSRLIQTQLRTSALAFFVSLGVYLMAWLMLSVFFGNEYQPALIYLRILLIRYFIWSSAAIGGVALFSLNLIHINFLISLLATITGLTGAYFLLQWGGLAGVAWAQAISGLVIFVLTHLTLWRVLRQPSLSTIQ